MAEPARGALTFKWAAIMDKYGALPHEIAALTDAQIDELCFHARDTNGGLIPPPAEKKPVTRESRLATIAQLEIMRLITPERAQELRDEVNNAEPGR